MITRRLAVAVAAVPLLAAALVACGSDSSSPGSIGAPPSSGDSSTPATSSAGSSAGSSASSASGGSGSSGGGSSASAPQLVAAMRAALGDVTSAKLTIRTSASGQQLTGTGVQKLAHNKLVAFDLTQQLPAGAGEQRIVIVDGKTYLKQPGITTDPAKPYVLVTTTSSNPIVRRLAGTLQQAQSAASLNASVGFLAAAKSLSDKGNESIDGTSARHYRLVVDPSKLPASTPNLQEIKRAGLADFPIDLYLDDKGRPLRTVTTVTVQSVTVHSQVDISDYDAPVTITAPPASQVTTG